MHSRDNSADPSLEAVLSGSIVSDDGRISIAVPTGWQPVNQSPNAILLEFPTIETAIPPIIVAQEVDYQSDLAVFATRYLATLRSVLSDCEVLEWAVDEMDTGGALFISTVAFRSGIFAQVMETAVKQVDDDMMVMFEMTCRPEDLELLGAAFVIVVAASKAAAG